MLYVFLVDTGTMYTFDMKLTMEPVLKLKGAIARVCRIPVDKQVLLISGGEPLCPEKLVCSYSAGTDTNPIFLFGKSTIESMSPPSPSIYLGSDMDLNSQVEGSLIMPASFDTVVSRTQLAMQIFEVDAEELRACERMVLDQHLQQQGWAAVVANLEDLVSAYFHRASLFQKEFKEFLQERDDVLALLRRIPDVLLLLERIPVLPCLESAPRNISSSHYVTVKHSGLSVASLNLYTWINTQDSNNRLEDVIKSLTEGTELMTETLEEKVTKELQEVSDFIRPMDMKDVRGLEERLYGLDQLMCTAGKLVDEQRHMAQGFVQNQTRVSDLKDHSILPDLCSSHKRQLVQMLSNHKRLHDIKRKCSAAKEELSANLHTRLRWVMFVQRTVNAMDNKLWLYHNNLDRIKGRASLLKQVETSPQTYAAMVAEVARRRTFVRHYLKWAEETSNEAKRQHKREVQRRKSFTRQHGTHFLQKMVPGFKDHVPKFAAEPLKEFDEDLPSISQEDLNNLAMTVPELKRWFRIPSDTSCAEFTASQNPLAADGGEHMRMVTQSIASEIQSITGSIEVQDVMGDMFEHIDRDKLSLSDQAGLGVQQERPPLDDRLALSLQEKFTVPESLSETLTAEVNSAAMSTITISVVSASPRQQVAARSQLAEGAARVVQEESGDGVLLSSGDHEPTKSSDSDAISHESLSDRRVRGKRCTKGLSDTSPDMETSQEFTTADFYIEDSMPSSMTDSPPKPGAQEKERGELDSTLVKTKRMSELETEVGTLQGKLEVSDSRLSRLHALTCCSIDLLKKSMAELKEIVLRNRISTTTTMSEMQVLALEACTTLVKNIEQDREQMLLQERSSSEDTIKGLRDQLELKDKQEEGVRHELLKVSKTLEDVAKELEQVRQSSEKELAALKEKHNTEMQDISSRNLLEMELETDRVRTELQAEMDRQESEIIKLEEQLRMSELRLQKVIEEKECSSEEMMKNFVSQKEQIHQALQEEFAVVKQREQEELIEKLGKEHQTRLDALTAEHQGRLDALVAEHQTSLDAIVREHQEKLDKVAKDAREEKSVEIQKVTQELETSAEKRLQEAKEKLLDEHRAELQRRLDEVSARHTEMVSRLQDEFEQERQQLKARCVAEAGTQSEGEEVITMEEHLRLLTAAETNVRNTALAQHQQMLDAQRQELEDQMEKREVQHQKNMEDALSSMKTSLMAERQVQFNEAISRLCQEKDHIIEEMKVNLESLELKVQQAEVEIRNMDELRIQLSKVKERESELSHDNRRLEDQVAMLQTQFTNPFQCMTISGAHLSSVVVPDGSQSVMHIGDVGQTDDSLAKPDWEQIASQREKKITELENKLMNMSMTASARKEARDKVSILHCLIGDLVLLCLDERHDQYVVFTVGSTLHFLHSDCIDTLGLRAVEGEPRKNWVLAEIIDREYCQARKAQNRFKVPVGTKFYRVKAKLWTPGASG